MKFIIIFSILISVVITQKPTPCTSPPQWEARVFESDYKVQLMVRGKLSYDSVYQRERIIEERILGSDQEFLDRLYLHNSQVEYVYNFKTKQCTKQTITRPWRDLGVPQNATSLGESYIGSSAVPNANILTTIWGANFTDTQGNKYRYLGVWSYEGCLPIAINYFSDTNGYFHSQFYDITPGLSDPSVFVPRPECL